MSSNVDFPNSYTSNFLSLLEEFKEGESNCEFLWKPSNYILKDIYETPDRHIYLNMIPEYKIKKNPKPRLLISLLKNFLYDSDVGWNWHKSWIIPTIIVKFSNIIELGLDESNLILKLYIVKAGFHETKNFCLINMNPFDVNKAEFNNGTAIIKNTKFTSTTFKNQGLKFHLLLVIHDIKNLNIIESKISSPIYVDSRKHARQTAIAFETKIFEWFPPEKVNSSIFKTKNIGGEVENSFNGFLDYCGSASIRQKVRNPLFFAFKFSNCFSIYYNKDSFQNLDQENIMENIILFLCQNIKNNNILKKKSNHKFIINKLCKNAFITIFIECEDKNVINKKIVDFLCCFDNRGLNVIIDKKENYPLNFQKIDNIEKFFEVYEILYEKKNKKKKNLKNDNEINNLCDFKKYQIKTIIDLNKINNNKNEKKIENFSIENFSYKKIKIENPKKIPVKEKEIELENAIFENNKDVKNENLSYYNNNNFPNQSAIINNYLWLNQNFNIPNPHAFFNHQRLYLERMSFMNFLNQNYPF